MNMITVSDKGQIAIPVSVREMLEINRGDELILTVLDDKIIMQKASDVEKKMKDEFKDVLLHSEKSLKKVWKNKSDDIWIKYKK